MIHAQGQRSRGYALARLLRGHPIAHPATGHNAVLDVSQGQLTSQFAVNFDGSRHPRALLGHALEVAPRLAPLRLRMCFRPIRIYGRLHLAQRVLVLNPEPTPLRAVLT